MIEDAVETTPEQPPQEMTLSEFSQILLEIRDQPPWRVQADKEMDYKDGNQLSSDLLSRMKELGVPPATMPLIGLSVESALGYEAKQRKDWRVIPDNDVEGQDVADAFNFKLNQAERRSRADKACSDAFESQYSVGVGWVEVTREQDPFKYPYRCRAIHRNEMFWDWPGYLKSPMGDEARWLVRKNWVNKDVLKLTFPEHADIIEHSGTGWSNFDVMQLDGGRSTELSRAQDVERGWTIEEQEWRNTTLKRVMLFEVWYRRWERVIVLKHPDGRTEELDESNEAHLQALVNGAEPVHAVIGKVRRAWFAGPHKLADDKSPYRHNHFGYVPFWGWKEDRTGTPYGRIRAMMYMQDNINASLSKIRWGLSSTVTRRTAGAYKGTATQLRNQVSRVDADIVLDQAHMALPGAVFEIDRNFQLNEQQYKMYVDAVASINKLGGLSDEFLGQGGQAKSGAQQAQTIEQTSVGLANIMDNFNESRSQVGELLLSMIVHDSIGKREEVNIDGGALRDDRTIILNDPYMDEMGNEGMNNDISRVMLKVNLEDVPSTSSYRNQQLAAFSEAFKSTTPDYQQLMMPHMINLMDIPNKQEIIQAMKEKTAQPSPEQQAQEAKIQELEVKRLLIDAQVKQLEAQAVKTMNEAQYNALQTAGTIVQIPDTAPIADVIMMNSGFKQPNPIGDDPNYPIPDAPAEAMSNNGLDNVHEPSPNIGIGQGIETQRISDNT